MKLVIGLGNPGNKYAHTKHNVGFDVVDILLSNLNATMTDQKFRADYTVVHHQGDKVLIVKPYTYMNLSGEALLPLMSYFGVHADDIVVVYDDLDLEPGKIRLREKGSAGGHNGIKNIIHLLGSQEFKRIKVGIGRPQPGWKVVDHVLAPFTRDDQVLMDEAYRQTADILQAWIEGKSFKDLMNQFN